MNYPRIHLSVDNCFASKRWTTPDEWFRIVRDELGLSCIEASADNECDPLYAPAAYRHDWIAAVQEAQARTGARVVSLYSGHGTYATLGLAHTDRRVRDHLLTQWIKPMAEAAGRLHAGLGFFAHAFPQSVLNDRARFEEAEQDLYDRLAQAAAYGAEAGATTVGVEQMYSPHQPPWTLAGTHAMLAGVLRRRGCPLYVTIDVGHQYGQRRFLRPTGEALTAWLRAGAPGSPPARMPWAGSERARAALRAAAGAGAAGQDRAVADVLADAAEHPHLFASHEDGDPYQWLDRLGCYSPIVHLQQTDGTSSAHKPFTAEHNAAGIIDPHRVLRALKASYERPPDPLMPPRCADIFLTIEAFSGTADAPDDILARMKASADFWRQAVPADGTPLDQLVDAPSRRPETP